MSALFGLNQALDVFIKNGPDGLYDQVIGKRPLLAMLLKNQRASETSGGVTPPEYFVRSDNLSGDKARFTLRTGVPIGRGVKARTGAIQDLQNPYREETTTVTLPAEPSFYENDEVIRAEEMDAYTSSTQPNIAPLIEMKATAWMDGLFEAINQDLFPAINLNPTRTDSGLRGEALEDRIMAVAHPLQTGQSGNAAGNSTSYDYYGYDLGLNSNSQAVNKGTFSGAVTLDFRLIRRDIILPLSTRMSHPDIALVDTDVFDQLADLLEDKIVLANADDIGFGVMGFELYKGVRFIHEPGLDRLSDTAGNKNEMYFLNTKTWSFAHTWPDAKTGRVNGRQMISIREPADTATFANMVGFIKARLVCLNPRANARVVNMTIA